MSFFILSHSASEDPTIGLEDQKKTVQKINTLIVAKL